MPSYFCTVGFGLDSFAVEELKCVFSDVSVNQVVVGKVFFETEEDRIEVLLKLKTIERLFLKVIHTLVPDQIDSLDVWLSDQLSASVGGQDLNIWRHITNHQEVDVKFRVNTRLSGKFRQASQFRHIASLASSALSQNLPSLVVDLQQPHLEVFLHLNDNFLTVGLPLSRRPLSDRAYLKHIAVRSTVCCALCSAVCLTSSDIVLDPMCGAATILVEAVRQFGCQLAVGVDNDPSQLTLARANLEASNCTNLIDLITADARSSFLLQRSYFDVVLCDVPFGRKFGRPEHIRDLLASVVPTIDAVLRPGGRIGILIRYAKSMWIVKERSVT